MSTKLPGLLDTPISLAIPEAEVTQYVKSPPFLPINNALNLRTVTSSTLKPNLIFRSGSLSHLPATTLTFLKEDYSITTIFDLRSGKEREKSPNPQVGGIKDIWIPSAADFGSRVRGENHGESKQDAEENKPNNPQHSAQLSPSDFVQNAGVDGYVKLYGQILETHRDAYRTVFEKLRDSERGGILFHCTAGKDRTGVLAALILALMHTPADEISRDYALTRIGIEPFREYLLGSLMQQMGRTRDIDFLGEPGMEAMCGTRGDYIVALLKSMNEKWAKPSAQLQEGYRKGGFPGVEGYLEDGLGFDKRDVEKIRSRLAGKTG